MTAHGNRLERLARAQRTLADLAAADRVRAARAYDESAAQADLIVDALNGPLHGIAVAAMADALTKNGRATEKLRRTAESAAAEHMRADLTATALDERAAALRAHSRSRAERRRIEELTSQAADATGRYRPRKVPDRPLR